ncbi:hypothetical protein [uncultured Ruminococcus sp.]|uniref:hypothetical protein n=1 Tax=uncultured Ruminococcus sp. TaxID=165186 RepID=UPI0025FA9A3F|nr:hypothetical protein [uncultured Ruminococcus sp.]
MSREVEVQNIQMTATTPENVQISLGQIGTAPGTAATAASGKSLASSSGVLMETTANAGASDGKVHAPVNDWDWSNTADISAYYQLGKLIPASSTTGANIYFTPDADGVGKSVKANASYIKANGTAVNDAGATQSGTGADTTKTFKTTLHANTTESDGWSASGGAYAQSVSWNDTKDDGYYVDIPVWFRTSSTAGATLKVEAYVIPNDDSIRQNDAGEALYRAVRVAVLSPDSQVGTGGSVTASNLLPVHDGWTGMTTTAYGNISTTPFTGSSVNDWYGGAKTNNVAVKANGTLSGYRFDEAIYGSATEYDGSAAVVTLAAASGTGYGDAVQAVIRVWLEGEDPDCWNDTAGQNWSINLKFLNGTTSDGKDISGTASTTPPSP